MFVCLRKMNLTSESLAVKSTEEGMLYFCVVTVRVNPHLWTKTFGSRPNIFLMALQP